MIATPVRPARSRSRESSRRTTLRSQHVRSASSRATPGGGPDTAEQPPATPANEHARSRPRRPRPAQWRTLHIPIIGSHGAHSRPARPGTVPPAPSSDVARPTTWEWATQLERPSTAASTASRAEDADVAAPAPGCADPAGDRVAASAASSTGRPASSAAPTEQALTYEVMRERMKVDRCVWVCSHAWRAHAAEGPRTAGPGPALPSSLTLRFTGPQGDTCPRGSRAEKTTRRKVSCAPCRATSARSASAARDGRRRDTRSFARTAAARVSLPRGAERRRVARAARRRGRRAQGEPCRHPGAARGDGGAARARAAVRARAARGAGALRQGANAVRVRRGDDSGGGGGEQLAREPLMLSAAAPARPGVQ